MECRTKFTFQNYESKSYGRSLIRKIQLSDQLFMPNQLIHQNIFIECRNRFLDHLGSAGVGRPFNFPQINLYDCDFIGGLLIN